MSMTQCQGGIDDTSELQAESFLQERERLATKGQSETGQGVKCGTLLNKQKFIPKVAYTSGTILQMSAETCEFLSVLRDINAP